MYLTNLTFKCKGIKITYKAFIFRKGNDTDEMEGVVF